MDIANRTPFSPEVVIMRRVVVLSVLLLAPAIASAEKLSFQITLVAGKHDHKNEPVCVPLVLPQKFLEKYTHASMPLNSDGPSVTSWGHFTEPGLDSALHDGKGSAGNIELHFILKELKAGTEFPLTLNLNTETTFGALSHFEWTGTPERDPELIFDEWDGKKPHTIPVLRYENAPLDESTKEKREDTFKVYHQLYTPDGSRLATKGLGGLYPHHRGLFFGFMKVTYDDNKTVDIWHCKDQTYQGHEKILSKEAGPVLGRHRVQIGWFGQKKEKFATEERELTAYRLPDGTLVDFVSKVTPVKGTVKFDGDPQHAGFHFRADNEVDKNKAQTIFIRPDGVGEPGKERNWPMDKQMVNLPWDAMSFVIGNQRYTLAYLDHPANPKEARDSERTYGRIGSYFVTEATPEKPLLVRYRVWLQNGQMKPEEVAALSSAFVEPVQVTVKKK
jgi:hypothetical protein